MRDNIRRQLLVLTCNMHICSPWEVRLQTTSFTSAVKTKTGSGTSESPINVQQPILNSHTWKSVHWFQMRIYHFEASVALLLLEVLLFCSFQISWHCWQIGYPITRNFIELSFSSYWCLKSHAVIKLGEDRGPGRSTEMFIGNWEA